MRHVRVIGWLGAAAIAAGILAAGTTPSMAAATSPDGRIAYSAWDDQLNYDVYVVDPADPGAQPVRLTTDGRNNGNPDWSPDGTKIAYDGWAEFGGPRIQVMDTSPATDDWTVISEPCDPAAEGCYGDFQPAWSPDGTRIAFVSTRPNADGTDEGSYEIHVMDAAGEVGTLADARRLTNDPPDEFGPDIENSQATWSPDGTRIAFLSTGRGTEPDSCDLWVMDSVDGDGDGFGDNLQRLTFDESFNCDPFEDVSPQWSPNSSLIAFTSVRSGYFDVWVVNADDPTDLRNVTDTPTGYEDQPSWSPDGTRIVFRSTASGAYELYSLPVPPPAGAAAGRSTVAATPTQLTFDGENKTQPDWGAGPNPAPGTVSLRVARHGRGVVRSTPAGIACGRDCQGTFVSRSRVKLVADARPGWRFDQWGGACADATGRTCVVKSQTSKTIQAVFVRRT